MSTPTDAEAPGALRVLVVGATGSIGRLAVAEAVRRGHDTRALVREGSDTTGLPESARLVTGDLTSTDSLKAATADVDAVVFTHGSHGGDDAERVDYGAVRNVAQALGGRSVRVALMTAIGVTGRNEMHDWKRRAERLVRASGMPYTIVRPGWFDYQDDDQHQLVMLQGDRRHAGSPDDGVIARQQIAEVLLGSLTSEAATRRTFELVAEQGAAQDDLEPLFAALQTDRPGAVDGVLDEDTMPESDEPARVRADLEAVGAS